MKKLPAVNLANVEKAMAIIAGIIRSAPDGDKYFPYFERLEILHESLQSRDTRLDAAIDRYRMAHTEAVFAPQNAPQKAPQ